MGVKNLAAESLVPGADQADNLAAAAHAATADNMSIISLIAEASLTVQLVMLMLFLASMVSWSIIFSKFTSLRKERILTKQFEEEFWSGGSMQALYNQWGAETK